MKQEAKIVYLLECLQKTAPPVCIFCEKKQVCARVRVCVGLCVGVGVSLFYASTALNDYSMTAVRYNNPVFVREEESTLASASSDEDRLPFGFYVNILLILPPGLPCLLPDENFVRDGLHVLCTPCDRVT